MPPSKPRPRHTAYGRPLPTLAPAPVTRPTAVDEPRNVELRAYIEELLTRYYDDLLQKGVHAEVGIYFMIQHGRLQPQIDVSVTRHHRFVRESE